MFWKDRWDAGDKGDRWDADEGGFLFWEDRWDAGDKGDRWDADEAQSKGFFYFVNRRAGAASRSAERGGWGGLRVFFVRSCTELYGVVRSCTELYGGLSIKSVSIFLRTHPYSSAERSSALPVIVS